MQALETPVVLLVFNRPHHTARVLDVVAKVRPRHLLVVADGPRPGHPTDAERCQETRALFDRLTWPAIVERDFAAANLGLRKRVSSGLTWAFSRVPEALILEDDCVPDLSFFRFCSELLARYRDDGRVASITGHCSDAPRSHRDTHSYYFSAVGLPWGWATWARAWKDYDADLDFWPAFRRSGWLEARLGYVAARQWERMFDYAYQIQSWWIRWALTNWALQRSSIVPRRNLVGNIGVGGEATHTGAGTAYERLQGIAATAMPFPLQHPAFLLQDPIAEREALERWLPWSSRGRAIRQLVLEGPWALRHRLLR